MTLVNGQLANQGTFNNAFVSRTTDTSTQGKVTLENAGSNTINDIQLYTNEIAESLGVTGEGDPLKDDYSSNNYVTDGTSRKVAIGALDTSLKTVDDDLQAHKSSTANPHSTTPAQIGAYTIVETDTAISTAITNLIDGAPAALDTLNELAAALNDDASFAGTVTTALAGKEPSITATTSADYYRGDKTFQTLNSTAVGLGNVTNDAQLKRAANDYTAITEKTTVVNDDLVLIEDSADSFNKKKVKMSNMGGGSGSGVASWLTATAYTVGQVVTYNRQLFLCLSAHTSTTDFGADYNSGGRWILTSKGDNLFQTGATFDSGNPDFWTLTTISGYSAGTWPTVAPTASGYPSISTIGAISGYASLVFPTATQYTLGSGIQYQILNIDKAHQGKVVNLSFDYLITGSSFVNLSGTSTNTFHVGLYDVTNSVWVQTSNTYGINSIGTARYNSTVQLASNTTSVIVCVFVANQNATGGVIIAFDNFELSRKIAPTGAVMTDPVQYTPIFGAGYGTVTNQKIYWTQSGKFMRVFGTMTAGATTAGTGEISLPSGRSIDVSFYQTSAKNLVGGIRPIINSGGAGSGGTIQRLGFDGTNLDKVWLTSSSAQDVAGGTFAKTGVNSAFATSDTLNIDFTVPIQGWSSNVQLSSDAGNSNVVFYADKGATQSGIVANVTKISYTSVRKDSSGSWNGTDTYEVKSPGDYHLIVGYKTATSSTTLGLFINGTLYKTIGTPNSTYHLVFSRDLPDLKAGDLLDLRQASTENSQGDSTGLYFIQISKKASPQTIAANDIVAMRYTTTAGQNILTSTITTVIFGSKDYDYTGSYNPATGVFTCSTPGLYHVDAGVQFTSIDQGGTLNLMIYKQGAEGSGSYTLTGATVAPYAAQVSDTIYLLAGQTLDIRVFQNRGNAITLSTNGARNKFSIVKVG